MLDAFIKMLDQADFISGYEQKESEIYYYGELVKVIVILIPLAENGKKIAHIFHAGTETLIDIQEY